MEFTKKLENAVRSSQSVLCVGLDPDPERFPESFATKYPDIAERVAAYCSLVIESASAYCAAFKPNLGFFEALGAEGVYIFEKLIRQIPSDKIIIADAKRGDIGNTALQYKKAFFDVWKCDAVTLSPLMGFETITPFLTSANHGVYALVLTSNPGAADLLLNELSSGETVSAYISRNLGELNERFPGHAGMVVGATQADRLPSILSHNRTASLLIPGIGAQGGDIPRLAALLKDHDGIPLINVSRSIMYGLEDQHEDADLRSNVSARARHFRDQLRPIAEKYL